MKIIEIIEKLCVSPNIASQKPIFEKYDKNVQGNTARERGDTIASIILPFRDFDELRLEDSKIGIAIATGGNPNIAKISPKYAAKNAVAEAATKIAMVGGEFLGVTDCLNFGNPEKPEQMGAFVSAIDGLKDACEQLQIPIVSGNVSFYNESRGKSIPPSAIVSVFGKVKDPQSTPSISFKKEGETIFLIGARNEDLGGSEFLRIIKKEDSKIPKVDLFSLKKWLSSLKKCVQNNDISTANFIGRGGLLMALLESSFKNELGFNLEIINSWSEEKILHFLFGEEIGVIITTPFPDKIQKEFGNNAFKIGHTRSDFKFEISHNDKIVFDTKLSSYKRIWMQTLSNIF